MPATRVPVIHLDHTFTFAGRPNRVTHGSDRHSRQWDGYTIVAVLSPAPGDWLEVEEGLHSMADVRWYLQQATAAGWAYLPDSDGRDPFAS